MNDIEIEAIIDRRVMARLATDSAYRNAENAEDQAEREAEITREEEEAIIAFTGTCQRCGSYWDIRQRPLCPCGGEVL